MMVKNLLLTIVSFIFCSGLNALSRSSIEEYTDLNNAESNPLRVELSQTMSPISLSTTTEVISDTITSINVTDISKLYYLTFSSKLDVKNAPTTGFSSSTSLSNVLLSDDSPFQEVELPWTFLFNGRWVSSVFINPNGALHFSKDQPCDGVFSVDVPSCNLDTSYYDAIAGFLTDLDPVGCTGANITYSESIDAYTILYSNFCYYGSTLSNTFSISLFDDDHVKINYYQVSVSSSQKLPSDYISGIRPPSDNTYLAYVPADQTNSETVWQTTITGYYPTSSAYVSSSYAYSMCPVSLFWCMQNSTFSLSDFQSSSTTPILSLSTIKLSCIDDLEYGLAYSTSNTINTTEIISCVASSTSMTLTCDVDSRMKTYIIYEVGSSSTSTVLLWLVWRSINSTQTSSSGSWTNIPAQNLSLTITTSAITNAATTVCNYNIDGCSARNLFDGNYTCLNHTCFTGSKASLFSNVNCDGVCVNSDTTATSSITSTTDPNGVCCALSSLDCAGYCNGGNVDALQYGSSPISYVCCSSVDCLGFCEGTATTNGCGVCEETSSASCYAVPTATELTAATIGTLFYATYSSSFNSSSLVNSGSTPATLIDLLQTDDSPFYQLDLSSAILFSGRLLSTVFINPNGAVHFSKQQPCYPGDVFLGIVSGDCNFDNSYYDLLAVFLTDLNPYTAANANITFSSDASKQSLYFENFSYFGSNITNSFMVRWYASDDRIEMIYMNITKTHSLPVNGEWLSGIRPAKSNPLVVFDSNDITTSSSVWQTDIIGSYPSTMSDVASDMQFTLCPQSVFWCMTPSILDHSVLTQTEDIQLNLTTIKLSCVEELTYSLIYSNSATYRNNSNAVTCDNNNTTSMPALTCLLPRHVIDEYKNSGSNVTLYLWVGWIVDGSEDTSVRVLPMQPLELLLLSQNITLPSNSVYTCNNEITGCSVESMAMGSFSCLNHSCYDGSLRGIFSTETCAETCSASTNITTEYVTGANNDTCCMVSDLDCAGYCNGNNTVAYYSATELSLFCCPETSFVDCAGVCNGDSVINICGVCTSTDIYGTTCYNATQLVIETGESDGNVYPSFDFALPPFISDNRITLRNTGAVDFIVMVTSSPDETVAPELKYMANLTVPANDQVDYWVNSSLNDLYNGTMAYWQVKLLTFNFTRIDYAVVSYAKAITIRPRSSGCDDLSADTCIRLPGCIYCLNQEFPILLRIYPASEVLYTQRRLSAEQHWMRKLFVAYTPPLEVNTGSRLQGLCRDGWLQNDCIVN